MILNKDKSITLVLGSMGGGGAERVASIIANNLAEYGYRVHIITLLDDKCAYKLLPTVQLKPMVISDDSRIKHLPKWIRDIRRYARNEKPNVMVAFSARISFTVFIACAGLGVPIIVSERSDPAKDGRNMLVKWGTYFFYRHAKNIVFQTKWAMSCFPERIQARGVIIYNPVYVPTRISDKRKNKIVTAGRLADEKNHRMLIDAFKCVHDKYPAYELHIFGEGDLEKDLQKQIMQLGLNSSVFLRGRTNKLHYDMSDAEFFVLSSDYEGLSNALLEAMTMGLPCISTDCAGSNEVIMDGENGLLVPVGSVKKLAAAMERLIVDKDLANYLSNRALIKSEEFRIEPILDRWQEIVG